MSSSLFWDVTQRRVVVLLLLRLFIVGLGG